MHIVKNMISPSLQDPKNHNNLQALIFSFENPQSLKMERGADEGHARTPLRRMKAWPSQRGQTLRTPSGDTTQPATLRASIMRPSGPRTSRTVTLGSSSSSTSARTRSTVGHAR